ncbi:hypothetical protein [Streptomyces sp. NPDC048606]|uniref:hypothetical protein n=1 Tax=Streptomyces sp. NPDC048606 TaxID=3154726 RepID=UPI0034172842
MRMRTTAAALLASLALVLPTAGQSQANANDRDYPDTLGELHYRYVDNGGDTRRRTIEPADNDTCYQLTGTRRNPAYWAKNETDSLAFLYEGTSCGGNPEEILRPGEYARDLNVRSVQFQPTDHGGHHGRDHDDWDDDRNRAGGQQRHGSLQDRALREAGIPADFARHMN